ncbi:MAG TPA: nucleoside-triphosphatase [Anaerolineae bacterium]|nr:nucleoside-triphosphatase [Anaerolineae bacterium]HQK12637.1 nucleoside-triphosphatase [Anaerolineae bacterium]
MGKTLLLTGHPGIGKTTIIRNVVAQLGKKAGGFYTEEIVGPGGRKGFRLITLDGRETTIAHVDLRDPKAPRVGRYGVDLKALESVGVAALQRAMQEKKLVVVDEIGAMELYSHAFCETVMLAILGPTPVLGTIMSRPHPESDAFKTLAQVTLWEVNRTTRDDLPVKVLAWVNKYL